MKIAIYHKVRAVAKTDGNPVVSVDAPPGEKIRRLYNRIQHWDDSTDPKEVNLAVREVADLNRKLIRSYEAALTDGYSADWIGTYGSANTEMLPGKQTIRARERTLTKDHAHGRAIPQIIADNVVGDDPFELEMTVMRPATAAEKSEATDGKVEDTEVSDALEQWWRELIWMENLTVNGNMGFIEWFRLVVLGTVSPGNVIGREYRGFTRNGFGYALDLVEEDRLQEGYVGSYNGNPIRGSMEFDAQFTRRAVAYWILTRHPGEFYASGSGGQSGEVLRERVPADEIILFSNLRERPEQDRGMTELASTLPAQWKKEQYARSLTIAAICSCIRAFVIEKKMPTGIEMPPELQSAWRNIMANMSTGGGEDQAQKEQGVGQPVKTMKPGQERELPWGYEAKVLAPEFPIEAAHEFIQDLLREIAVGAKVPFQELSGDYQNLGFMAALSCKQPFHRWIRIRQNVLKEHLRRIFKNALRESITVGWFDRNFPAAVSDKILLSRLDEFVRAHKFKAQQFEFINPMVQMQALIIGNNAGHLTDQQVQNAIPGGQKIEKHYEERMRERKMKLKLGLPLNEEVTEPNINKEGDAPLGTTKPVPDELGDGGAADKPPVTKVARPQSRSRSRVDDLTMAMAMSTNGEH